MRCNNNKHLPLQKLGLRYVTFPTSCHQPLKRPKLFQPTAWFYATSQEYKQNCNNLQPVLVILSDHLGKTISSNYSVLTCEAAS